MRRRKIRESFLALPASYRMAIIYLCVGSHVLMFRCYYCRFHGFFNQIDQFKSNHFLWLTAGGLKVAELNKETESGKPQQDQDVDKALGDEDEEDPEGGEG